MAIESPDVNSPIRELVDGAFLELFYQEQIRAHPAISDTELEQKADSLVRRTYLYRYWFIRNRLGRMLRDRREQLVELICVKGKYCERRAAAEGLDEWLVFIETLLHLVGHVFFPFSLAWLLVTGAFDELCGCKSKVIDRMRQLLRRLKELYWPTPQTIREKRDE
jgi:hypothetical protein